MKTFVAVFLSASIALAEPPSDAPLAEVPGTSVHLATGQAAPFPGRLVSDAEAIRRARKEAGERAILVDAEANGVLLPKPAVAALISASAAAVITSIALGVAYAAKK